MHFLMTVDVESHSIALNREDPEVISQIHKEGLPKLLDLFSIIDVCATFYFTGTFAEQSPESVELVQAHGHEVGCHGYDHSPGRALDLLGLKEQIVEMKKGKKAIEDVAGSVTSFRAPALRINQHSVRALEKTGFTSDSSIASQRFDGPFTFGARKKLGWLIAPRKPYKLSYKSPTRDGDSGVLEVPISALFIPFIGTTLRISPFLVRRVFGRILYRESRCTGKPIVFLFHPNECIEGSEIIATRRSTGALQYLFADLIRQRFKLKNLGGKSIKLVDDILRDAKTRGFEFMSVGEYRKFYK